MKLAFFSLNTVVLPRQIEYYLKATVRGGNLAVQARMFPPSHRIHQHLCPAEGDIHGVDLYESRFTLSALVYMPHFHFNVAAANDAMASDPIAAKNIACAQRVYDRRYATYTLWADGSASLDVKAYAAAILLKGEKLLETVQAGVDSMACGCRAECVALWKGIHLLSRYLRSNPFDRGKRRTRVAVFTDSRSLLQALATGPTVVREGILCRIWRQIIRLYKDGVYLSFQFFFWLLWAQAQRLGGLLC